MEPEVIKGKMLAGAKREKAEKKALLTKIARTESKIHKLVG